MIVVTLLMGGILLSAQTSFDQSYVDPDTAKAKETYEGIMANLSFSQADAIVQDICIHTGDNLFLDEQKSKKDSQYYRTLDNGSYCKVNNTTGEIFYRKHTDRDDAAPGLPSKKNAVALAKKHLKALGLEKDKMIDPIVTTIETATYNGQTTEIYEETRVVTFYRNLGGLKVKGASRIVVMMGAYGELEGLFVRWMGVKANKIKGKIAKSQLKDYIKSQLNSKHKEPLAMKVKKADLVLYDNGKGIIEPVLQLTGEVTTENGTFGTDWMVPVLTEPKAQY